MNEETITLFRPTGKNELALIEASGFTAFPPRLTEQPIFYPVTNEEYAAQIARDWNAKYNADYFRFVILQKLFSDRKLCDVAEFVGVVFRIPIAGDLCGVFFVGDGIKNRLFRQTRRKRCKTACFDQCEFIFPGRAK